MDGGKADEQLLAEFVRGRKAALGELAGRYERGLLGLAAGLLGGDQILALDAVQETWLRVVRFGGKFDGRSRFKSWLYRITINQCENLRLAERHVAGRASSATPQASEPQPDGLAQTRERDDRLRMAVGALMPERRLVVLLCYHEGMTHEQAADVLDVPLGTLKSRLHAALAELRERLSSEQAS